MGILGTQVCTSHHTESHYGTIKTEENINHSVTDESVKFLNDQTNNINDNIVSLIRHKNNFLNEVILTVEYCPVNRRFYLRYLFKINYEKISGAFKYKGNTVDELDNYYTEEKINEELCYIVSESLSTVFAYITIRFIKMHNRRY